MDLSKLLKSKTLTLNGILTLAIVAYAQSQGIDVDPETAATGIALVYGVGNGILRFFTNSKLADKLSWRS